MKCAVCGKEELLPFKCKYCGEYFCAEHRLPEIHNCPGIHAAASPYEKEMKEIKARIKSEEEFLKTVSRKASRKEIFQIILSTLLVSLVGISLIGYLNLFILTPLIIILYVTGFALSYLLHELAHRYVARTYKLKAYFKLDPIGSLLTFISAIPDLPIKFIAPGAVVVPGLTPPEIMGRIAFWGPTVNLILSIIFYISSTILKYLVIQSHFYVFLLLLAKFNAFIALFNLIPFGPLDGLKIIRWSMSRWASTMALSIVMLIVSW
ncbi:MAG: AN1-type zinc finger domain-containing protein [Nitrososphaerota archaeon]